MNKLFELCDMIDSLDIPESTKFKMRMAAASVENAGMTNGYKIGFSAGLKEGKELEQIKIKTAERSEQITIQGWI